MASAVLFLPLRMSTLTNFASILLLYFGSGRISLFTTTCFLGIVCFPVYRWLMFFSVLFRSLRAVLGTALLAVGDTHGVQRAAHDVIADTREVLHPAAADHDDRVFLE